MRGVRGTVIWRPSGWRISGLRHVFQNQRGISVFPGAIGPLQRPATAKMNPNGNCRQQGETREERTANVGAGGIIWAPKVGEAGEELEKLEVDEGSLARFPVCVSAVRSASARHMRAH